MRVLTSRTDRPFQRIMGWAIGRALLAGLLLFFACLHPSPAKAEGFGPFPVRNFQPLHQLVLSMPGDRAAVLKKGTLDVRLELAETASIFREEGSRASATMKFETLRSGMFLRYGATERWELSLEVPILYRYRGFMEEPIKAIEQATTGLAPARDQLRDADFVFNISRGGRTFVSGREGALGVGDSTVMSKYQVLSERAWLPTVSIRMALKLPTGNERQFFGSGSPDIGFGLAAEKGFGGRWMVYSNVNGVIPTGRIAGLSLQPTISGLAALEYLWSENLSFTAQFQYYSTPFHGVGTPVLDKDVTESVVGFSYRLMQRLLWQVYGVENLDFIRGSAADFTLSTLLTHRFTS
jgi:Protein of unknown function (DUF3187)